MINSIDSPRTYIPNHLKFEFDHIGTLMQTLICGENGEPKRFRQHFHFIKLESLWQLKFSNLKFSDSYDEKIKELRQI